MDSWSLSRQILRHFRLLLVGGLLIALAGCGDESLMGPEDQDIPDIPAPSFSSHASGPFTQIDAGSYHVCGLRDGGVLDCWGSDVQGPVTTPPGGSFVQVSSGETLSCALRGDGVVECWGDNTNGQAPTTRSASSGGFVEVAAGGYHACALRNDSVVECWGDNAYGQAPATRAPSSGTFVKLSAGLRHTCALRSDGALECWGYNGHGQAPGVGTASVGTYADVAAGYFHTCALRSDGVVECLGFDAYGQAPPTTQAAVGTFTQVSTNVHVTCALRSDGAANCWGSVNWGGIGVVPPSTGVFTQVSTARVGACGLRDDGAVECWGNSIIGTPPETEPVDSDGDGVPDVDDDFPNDPSETTDSDGDGVGDNADAFPNDPTRWATTGAEFIQAPASLDEGGALESDATLWWFKERTDVTLTSAVAVDAVNPGTYSSPVSGLQVPAGTVVNSYLVHLDRVTQGDHVATITFDEEIVALIAATGRLDATDALLGAPGTDYDLSGLARGAFDGDALTIHQDRRTLTLDLTIAANFLDQVRVLTEGTVVDSDGDGVPDVDDDFPNDPSETTDSDGDGVGDNADAFPNDPTETTDSDGDGVGDNADAFPNDPTETADSDGDGVGDNADAFPNDPTETVDSDGDGVGDNADAFPNDPTETTDSDGDGVGDNSDAFPNSDLSPTVVIDGCDSGVANQLLPGGATFNDLIAAAADEAKNHGQFVSAVTQLANEWKKDGLITGKEKGAITSCAG